MNRPTATSKWQYLHATRAASASLIRRCTAGLGVCLWISCGSNVLSACPNCKDALAANHQDAAFAMSILFMMAAPFTLMLIWAMAIWRMRQQPSEPAVLSNEGFAPHPVQPLIAPPSSLSTKASGT